jgi:NADH:ubiquinone oxidoreductase subunit 6 (subunit J)
VTLEAVGFWAVAVALLASSLGVVLSPNLFHAVLYLAGALVATGGVFLLLEAPFLFAVQLLLYAGGVVTIVVFAIMLTERLVGERLTQTNRFVVNAGIVAAGLLVAVIGYLVRRGPDPGRPPFETDTVAEIGRAVTGPFALTLELLGVLLVASLLGALYLARPED